MDKRTARPRRRIDAALDEAAEDVEALREIAALYGRLGRWGCRACPPVAAPAISVVWPREHGKGDAPDVRIE